MEYCASDDWRRLVHETILPVALRGVELGDRVMAGSGDTVRVLLAVPGEVVPDPPQAAVAATITAASAARAGLRAARPPKA